ncbi:uncharacterized protein LOC144098708 [Amblyomma americanum]
MQRRTGDHGAATALLLLAQLTVLWTPTLSQGILSEEEAAYYGPSAKQMLPPDPLVDLLRGRLPSNRPIASRGGLFTVNETLRGTPYVGHVLVQKGLLDGLSSVSRSSSCGQRDKIRLVWSRVTATFKFKALVNSVRVLGMAKVSLFPATLDVLIDDDGLTKRSYRVAAVRASSFSLSSLKNFTRLAGSMSRQLTYASQAALRAFLAGEARKVLDTALRTLLNEATPGAAFMC